MEPPKQTHERALWESRIELGQKFFHKIVSHPVPLDMNTLKALRRSPLGLDLYLWLTYRTFYAPASAPSLLEAACTASSGWNPAKAGR